ncbi:uncharacterized protein LOC124451345 [Xenia sp. Carnegie-2017]|uniref:uncharacterized protein LOC124451345 n=1 Tax=Xenia sp. Carnegie-2017 TaxID=2897299 RepID=UPI001F0332D4|nr:uncharacterized protein LOC124451345 [Xenia sp. Carnegie-2017]
MFTNNSHNHLEKSNFKMALAFQREQLGVQLKGDTVSVPDDPKAKLMYYLNCISTVLELDDMPSELTDFAYYYRLTEVQTDVLLELCLLLKPDLLNDKCIFERSDLPNGAYNKFLELSSIKTTMVATSNVMMGGRNVRVLKIMLYKPIWRRINFDEPMAAMARRLGSRKGSRKAITSGRRQKSGGCIIS